MSLKMFRKVVRTYIWLQNFISVELALFSFAGSIVFSSRDLSKNLRKFNIE